MRDLPDERSEQVSAWVAEYLDRLNSGETLDPLKILAEHPELGPDILENLETFVDLSLARPEDELVGVLGDYTLRRPIGRGGMGVVYEAWQGSVERPVALKVLPADTKAVTRFAREARVAAQLKHPSIVSVFGMGIEAETPYYAMLTGQSPRRLLRS